MRERERKERETREVGDRERQDKHWNRECLEEEVGGIMTVLPESIWQSGE